VIRDVVAYLGENCCGDVACAPGDVAPAPGDVAQAVGVG
jgi:hypothetical protein